MAIDHIATPAVPPAMMIAPRLRSDGDWPAGVKSFFVTSYAAKYLNNSSEAEAKGDVRMKHGTHAALPGPSRKTVAVEPRKTLRTPPSRYKCFTTSNTPLYWVPPCPCPWIWRDMSAWVEGCWRCIYSPAREPSPALLVRSQES